MLRLLNYELQRKWKMSLGILIGYFIIYFGMMIKFSSSNNMSLEQMPYQLVLFIVLASALFIAAVIGAINNLRLEAKQSTRDLYFSIPMTAYTKVGSKVIVSLIEASGAILIGAYTCVKAFEKLTGLVFWKHFIKELLSAPKEELILALLLQVLSMVMSIVIVYLSFAIFRSFFTQIKFGGIITIIIYIGLNYIIVRYINPAMGVELASFDSKGDLWIALIKNMLLCTSLFALTGYLFEKRVSFD